MISIQRTLFILTRRLIYLILGAIDNAYGRQNKLLILCYHSIGATGWDFSVSVEQFSQQMEYLATRAIPLTLTGLSRLLTQGRTIDKPSFIITFDDGYQDILTIKPILQRYHIQPCVFVLSEPRQADRSQLHNQLPLLSKAQLKALTEDNWEIGCHGATHKLLVDQQSVQLNKEIILSKLMLEKVLGKHIDFFAYPKGVYNQQALAMVQHAGYKLGLSMDDVLVTTNDDRFKLPRVGVDGSHSLAEFKVLGSPSVIAFRKLIKRSFMKQFIV